jgi:hypothetical protein
LSISIQRSPVLLTVLDDDLLLIPAMPCVMISNQIVGELMAIRAEPAIERSQSPFPRAPAFTVQCHEPRQVEEQAAIQVERNSIGLLVKEDIDRGGIDCKYGSQTKDKW